MGKQVIINTSKSLSTHWKEIIEYKYLLWNLAYRDFKVRYVQTVLGPLWAIINPIVTSVLLIFIFGRLAKVDTLGYPMIVITMSAMTVWTFISTMISDGGNSLLFGQQIMTKIYFPKILLPLSKSLIGMVDATINFILFAILFFYYNQTISNNIIFFPIVLILIFLTGIFFSILISSLIIRLRDFQYIVPLVLRLGFFLCPISYPASLVPQEYRLLYFLNPIAGLMELTRWSIIKDYPFLTENYISIGMVLIIGIVSLGYFSKIESKIVDYL